MQLSFVGTFSAVLWHYAFSDHALSMGVAPRRDADLRGALRLLRGDADENANSEYSSHQSFLD